jgi:hypothetical protein
MKNIDTIMSISDSEKKVCVSCHKTFDATLEFFYKNKIKSDGTILFKGKCKKCYIKNRPSSETTRLNGRNFYKRNKIRLSRKRFEKKYAIIKDLGIKNYQEFLKKTYPMYFDDEYFNSLKD